ncbi:MAG: YraN family protein [Candidatus Pacebacteria bacterium]|nr:YraN family protein [Candidatus Paceibacterota bacterium]
MVSFWTTFGTSAEAQARLWLSKQGYIILDYNWRRPWGELDIVAEKDAVIHFIEVKASVLQRPGFEPYVRAGATKMLKVQRTARTWLAQHRPNQDTEWQMDVISVIMQSMGPTFEHFQQI